MSSISRSAIAIPAILSSTPTTISEGRSPRAESASSFTATAGLTDHVFIKLTKSNSCDNIAIMSIRNFAWRETGSDNFAQNSEKQRKNSGDLAVLSRIDTLAAQDFCQNRNAAR